jgi:hypothetical protein
MFPAPNASIRISIINPWPIFVEVQRMTVAEMLKLHLPSSLFSNGEICQ